ncbi:MAG: SDR family oxidoreductase [Planctomycetales bacterium]|nr:SDR family oxidoreductase [Planctomycetales bacterium]
MYEKLFDLSGRVALVTGGSRGIGQAVARGYAEAGADVMLVSRSADDLARSATVVSEGLDVRVETLAADLGDREEVIRVARETEARLGKVDILFANAGTNLPQPLLDTTEEVWDKVLELNFSSCMWLAKAVAGGMVERGWGRIVYTSSVLAFASNPGRGLYSATKAALVAMSRAQALELSPHGVTVNCLAPGPVLTDLTRGLLSDEQKLRFQERTAVKRWGEVIDMVGPTLLISSDAGAFITGNTILADGGMLCRTFD